MRQARLDRLHESIEVEAHGRGRSGSTALTPGRVGISHVSAPAVGTLDVSGWAYPGFPVCRLTQNILAPGLCKTIDITRIQELPGTVISSHFRDRFARCG